jgi:hypothetical protein
MIIAVIYKLNFLLEDALKDKTSPHKLNETLEKTENKKVNSILILEFNKKS